MATKLYVAAKMFVDKRGWRYRVMEDYDGNLFRAFKAKYIKPGSHVWSSTTWLPWRETAAEAQADLDAWAKKKGMEECDEHD